MLLAKIGSLLFFPLAIGIVIGQQAAPPPPPPRPPQFMSMKGLLLSCFLKPNFEQDGLEFFVCNGGGGLAGVRKKDDPAHAVFVRDPEIAQNLNMQVAKGECGNKPFSVSSTPDGVISFHCEGKELDHNERFKSASKADWKKYENYLNK